MTILNKAEKHVTELLEKLPAACSFHNLQHTRRVVQSTKILAAAEAVSDKDNEILLLAAWFHDTGFIDSCVLHEAKGATVAEAFLRAESYPEQDILTVQNLIKATVLYYEPKNLLEKIIRDADSSHVGSDDFTIITEMLRNELKNANSINHSKLEWAKINLDFLSKHKFYTSFAQNNWESKKKENIVKLENYIKEKESLNNEKATLNKKKLEKMETPERGIETMFRVTMPNHTHLSQIADTKANILLSVNAIIISVALSTIVPKLDAPSNAHLVLPTFILVGFSVATIVMAIISTRPKVSGGSFTKKDIEDRKVNLLFFGNFYNVNLEDYTWAMKEMMKDKNYLYDSMIKDLHSLGVVLSRKYRLLRTTYTIFTVGILVSVLSFFLAFKGIL